MREKKKEKVLVTLRPYVRPPLLIYQCDQYHVSIPRAQVKSSSRSAVFLRLAADYVRTGLRLDRRLKSG